MTATSLARRGEKRAIIVDQGRRVFGTALQQRSLVTPD